jgi:hypothetical protein
MPSCKLCGLNAKLVKAHIIPKSFWEIQVGQPLQMLTNIQGEFPRRSNIGVYDNTIICQACERSFSNYDNHSAKVFLSKNSRLKPIRDAMGNLLALLAENIDYSLMKLFDVSVLWRAAASSHRFFEKVQIGTKFFEQARRMLVDRNPGDAQEFGMFFARWKADEHEPILMDPFRERFGGVNFYRFYLGRVLIYIKVDQRKVPEAFERLVLRPGAPAVLVCRDLQRSKELPLMRRIAWKNTAFLGSLHR